MPEPITAVGEKVITIAAPATAAIIFMVRWIRSDRAYHDAANYLAHRVDDLEEEQDKLRTVNRELQHRCLAHELRAARTLAHIDDLEKYLRDLGLDVPPLSPELRDL